MREYRIDDHDLTDKVRSGLIANGWVWDNEAQEWRKHNEAGSFSPHRADHVRAFDVIVALILSDLEVSDLEVVEDQKPDNVSSRQVQDNDMTEAGKALFAADALKTGYVKSWDDAPEGMKKHFISLASKPPKA